MSSYTIYVKKIANLVHKASWSRELRQFALHRGFLGRSLCDLVKKGPYNAGIGGTGPLHTPKNGHKIECLSLYFPRHSSEGLNEIINFDPHSRSFWSHLGLKNGHAF